MRMRDFCEGSISNSFSIESCGALKNEKSRREVDKILKNEGFKIDFGFLKKKKTERIESIKLIKI